MAAAREQTGLTDFGDEGFRQPLAVLAQSLDEEAGMHAIGRATQRARLVDSLAVRLVLNDFERRHPEITREELGDPLVIVGLARTGTTMLHRLLAADPAHTAARWWEVRYPAPPPGWDWRGTDPRIAQAQEEVRQILEAVPALAAIHPWEPEAPDEEVMLLEHSFRSWVPESGADVPSYRDWLARHDLRPGYSFLVRLLRFLQWQKRRRGERLGRWVLKSPFHLGYVDRLFEVFPGARVIQTHRDPVETIPSVASFYRALWALNVDTVDTRKVGAICLERYAWAARRCREARKKLPAARFFDVRFEDVTRRPVECAREIYQSFGLPFTPELAATMQRHAEAHARSKRPPHHYTLEEFGYTADAITAEWGTETGTFFANLRS